MIMRKEKVTGRSPQHPPLLKPLYNGTFLDFPIIHYIKTCLTSAQGCQDLMVTNETKYDEQRCDNLEDTPILDV